MDQVSDLHEALPLTCDNEWTGQTVHVEVCKNPCSTARNSTIQLHVEPLVRTQRAIHGDTVLKIFEEPFLLEHVHSITICDDALQPGQVLDLKNCHLIFHVYQLSDSEPGEEMLDTEEEISAASHYILPCTQFQGSWENLIFDSDIKFQLLWYARTTLLFSDKKVDCNVISWNRVVLLHGPPGTGKTSLCKALAQKLVIHMSDRYSFGQLIEINSHSLFSKWFSESGKLVMKMFQKIQEFVDNPDALVCVLIDEVESLTAARKASMGGTEPSDAIRVVNALLTQIDQIKRNPNVIILTTSNITGAIDLAFVDRADVKQYIGLPSTAAIYKIYQSCINELMRTGIIATDQIFDLKALELMRFTENAATGASLHLRQIAEASQGLSGRTLRKMPFLAHALFIQSPSSSLPVFLKALENAVKKQFEDRTNLSYDS